MKLKKKTKNLIRGLKNRIKYLEDSNEDYANNSSYTEIKLLKKANITLRELEKPKPPLGKIDVESKRYPNPPKPPPGRMIIEGVGHFCKHCGSSRPRSGWLGLFGKRECPNCDCDSRV